MNLELNRGDASALLDALDLALGAYPADTAQQIQQRFAPGTDDRQRLLRLVNQLSLAIGKEAA